MKTFLYCETQEGGMDHFEFTWKGIDHPGHPLTQLRGWMDPGVMREDSRLRRWINKAEVGEYTEHRLGVCIRLKNQ